MYQSSANLDLYAFQYKYDDRNRCIWKKLPGSQYAEYTYDTADRLTFSQDGRQRASGKWTFYEYDQFDRLMRQGECANKTVSSNTVVNIQNYYDNYDFLTLAGFTNRTYFPAASISGKGVLTGSAISVLGSSNKIYTANYYDVKGRVTKSVSNNLLGGYETISTVYTFTDNPVTVAHTHTASGKPSLSEVYKYTYDYADRVSKVEHTLNGVKVTLADNTYDNVGRLQAKSLHGSATNKLTYAYNIRNWLTGITATRFTQNLFYNTGYGTACYNGNISSMTWKGGSESTVRGYKFSYDGLNRLTNAVYGETSSINTNLDNFTEKVIGYDKNGNITALQRRGQTATSIFNLIDNLTYSLTGNQVSRVDDAVTASAYNNGFEFKNGANAASEYTYDASGNLTKDLNKGISSIQYNILNLPSGITFSDGSINYLYSADGTKLRTIHKTGSTTTTTDYCDNVIYENGTTKLLLIEEGYVSLSDSKYHYYLKDHQGNNRVVINQTGSVEETNHYYPFGGVFASTGNVQPYKYNGKKLDTKKGLNWYDYGARNYDAALGRFTTNDPLAEKYHSESAYTYCGNNPIRYIDPTGMLYIGFTVDEKGSIKKVNNEGGNEYDVLYSKSNYSSTIIKDYDTSGNKTGIKISKGILNEQAGADRNMSAKTIKGSITDGEGYITGKYANHSYEIKSDKESLALMNFLDKNTSVEWENTLMKDAQGKYINLLSTSHDGTTIKVGSYQTDEYIRNGFQIIRADHIHPTPGAIDASKDIGDKGNAANILKHSPNAKFRILNLGKYYPYRP